MANNKIYVIDGYSFVFRAYHSMPPLTNQLGQPVGAVYGFTSMLFKIITDFKPTHAVVTFDSGGKTFRHELYKEYKAHRPEVPEDLITQFPLVRQAVEAMNLHTLEKQGFEADDLIATIVNKSDQSDEVVIVSSDKDLMQLICERVKMYDSMKDKFITKNQVFEKFGVGPEKVLDLLALVGDSSDNIPGVPGIGPKTAAELLNSYGDLEGIYAHLDNIKQAKRKETLENNKNAAFLSRSLVTLDHNVDLGHDFKEFKLENPNIDKLREFLEHNNFRSLKAKAEKVWNINFTVPMVASQTSLLPIKETQISSVPVSRQGSFFDNMPQVTISALEVINSQAELEKLLKEASNHHAVYLFHLNLIKQDKLHSISFSYGNKFYLVVQQEGLNCLGVLKSLLAHPSLNVIGFDLKNLAHMQQIEKISSNIEDLQLMHYSMSAGKSEQDILSVLAETLSCHVDDIAQEVKSDRKINDINDLDLSRIKDYHFSIIYNFPRLYDTLKNVAHKSGAFKAYNIDKKLLGILFDMENVGVKIDQPMLAKSSTQLEAKANELASKIYQEAGSEFNIGSPKQLGEVLFKNLGLEAGKVSKKSGEFSTNSAVLENLSLSGHVIADLILEWRHVTKLKNTYTDILPTLINPNTGRVHTTFLQTTTTTGRLSSQDPNLQNIPIRSELGNSIRKAFIAEEGNKLISADYSQVELRILAHIADVKHLKEAFKHNLDIHTQTASQIFQIDKSEVNSDHRRKAKAINYGIVYGISPFGLAKQLNVSRGEAAEYIKTYFREYPEIKKYMDDTIEFAKKHGFVESIFNRKCFVSQINSNNYTLRGFAERAAINAPIQGCAADIVKFAMFDVQKLLSDYPDCKMLLQVHDELLFEVPENQADMLAQKIKMAMEQAVKFSVPLIVDAKVGHSWADIH